MQTEIIKALRVKPSINPKFEIISRVEFLEKSLKESGLKTLVLGISGGQDSTLVGKLCQLVVDKLGKDYRFIAVRLPYGIQSDEEDCQKALDFINPSQTITTNIKQSVDSMVEELTTQGIDITDFNKGNIKARTRMVSQYAIAGANSGLVVGTDHSSESITGFYTKFGDGGFDIGPIFGLNKRQGKQLLMELNCPKELYLKTPTADLEEDKPALADEIALGLTYDEIDDYLEGKEINIESKNKLENMYIKSQHKREMPRV